MIELAEMDTTYLSNLMVAMSCQGAIFSIYIDIYKVASEAAYIFMKDE